MKKRNKCIIQISLFILVIVLPLFLSKYFFPLTPFDFERKVIGNETKLTIPIDKDIQKETKGRKTILLQSVDYEFEPSFKGAIESIFGVPFGLDLYYICFVDEGSTIGEVKGLIIDYDLVWHINFSNEVQFNVSLNEESCLLINKKYINTNTEKIQYNWAADINFSIRINESYQPKNIDNTINRDLGGFQIIPRTNTYITPEKYSTYTKRILFIISWFSLILLLFSIIHLISGYDVINIYKK